MFQSAPMYQYLEKKLYRYLCLLSLFFRINSSQIQKFNWSPIKVTIVAMSVELPFQKPGQTFQTEILIQTVQHNVLHDFVLLEETVVI